MIYNISENGVNFIKAFEGVRLKTYKCSAGIPTIGYGHALSPESMIESISEEEAETLLKLDLQKAENIVRRNISAPLLQNQFDALVSFSFNVGAAALQRSTLRQKINYHAEAEEIYSEFMRWVYAAGHKIRGLQIRRHAEAKMYGM